MPYEHLSGLPEMGGEQILLLTRNDIRARYAGARLGALWSMALPLLTLLVLWYVYERGFGNPPVENVPYILWFTSAYLPWIFFSDLLTGGCRCLLDYSFLITRIPFHVPLLPLIRALSALFFHLLFLLLLTMILFFRGAEGKYLIQLPIYVFLLFLLGLGLSFLLGVGMVCIRDLEAMLQGLLQLLFWASPVLWNPDAMEGKEIRRILSLNPLSFILEGYRDALLGRRWIWERREAACAYLMVTGIVWLFAVCLYRKVRPFLADRLH